MSFTSYWDEENRYVEVRYHGMIDTAEVKNAVGVWARLAQEHELEDHLIDYSQVQNLAGVINFLWTGIGIREIADIPLRKVALIIPKSERIAADFRYYINTNRDCGVIIQAFMDRQDAISWLTGKEKQIYPEWA